MVVLNAKQVIQRTLVKVRNAVSRRKTDEKEATWEEGGGSDGPQLRRILGLFDLTLLGVGSTLGVGVYVLAGSVAKSDSGPAVTLAFVVAAVASAFAGVCYAEFAARVPKAGSAYIYSYVTVGELAAFVIGWNLILEYVIGTASVARAFSSYIDTLAGGIMRTTLTDVLPLNVSFLSPYPDFLSLGIVLVLSVLLAWGVKESALMNNVFTALNLITVIIVIVAGLWKVDPYNWQIPKSAINVTAYPHAGEGGFAPFGVAGIMAGAAKCFFGFVGFDCVATTGEEAKNPQRHIPLAIVISLVIIFVAYFGIATVLTMMLPYYEQNSDAPLIYVFGKMGMPVIKIIVSVGAIFALCTSLFGCIFPLPRVLYAMANDGLMPKFFSKIMKRTGTPVLSTFLSGIFAAFSMIIYSLKREFLHLNNKSNYLFSALCFSDRIAVSNAASPLRDVQRRTPLQNLRQNQLEDSDGALFHFHNGPGVSMLGAMWPAPRLLYSMGNDRILFRSLSSIHPVTRTPVVATVVAGLVEGIMAAIFNLDQLIDMMSIGTLLAYTIVALCVLLLRYRDPKMTDPDYKDKEEGNGGLTTILGQCLNIKRYKTPNRRTSFVVELWVAVFIISTLVTTILMVVFEDRWPSGDPVAVAPIIIFFIIVCLSCFFICLQPKDNPTLFFKVPLIPVLPCVSIFINVYLMMKLDVNTWIRFIIWLVIGGLIYIFYSIPNSLEGKKQRAASKERKMAVRNGTQFAS